MNTQLAYTYLKKYHLWRQTKDAKCDPGLIITLLLLQTKFGLSFNIPNKAFTIQESIRKVYQNTHDDILRYNGRQYLYAAYKKEIDVENIYNKLNSVNVSLENGYEIVHLILTVIFLEDVKHVKCIEKIITDLINILKLSDLKTEALYILFLINPHAIQQKWIDEITKNQQSNGSFKCEDYEKYNDTQARHTSHVLILTLSYSKFQKTQQIIKYSGVILVVIIYLYVYLSLKQYKANSSIHTNNVVI